MKIECILELMQDKGYIEIFEHSEEPMPPIYIIKNHRGKEFGKKLFHAILEEEDYLADYGNNTFSKILFAKKADIDEWLETLTKEITKIRWICGRLDTKLFKYIEERGFKTYYGISGFMEITNLKVKEERLRKTEEENQKAIDLLDQLL